ncbi:MAG: metallophosphoesterase family protein [Flavobacteriaceae bacterium]|nr:metallophosphoesterase family protein [Flavobacteriaceae bacterium]
MSITNKILSKAFKNAKNITIDKGSKIIFFSDLHRGDNSYADDFRHNMIIHEHALKDYFKKEFTYIEIGDGIELWENKSFAPIYHAHKASFDMLKEFRQEKRLFLLWGNHDMEFRDPIFVEKLRNKYFLPKNLAEKNILFDLKYYESLLLSIENTNKTIFVLHGHQADYMNYIHWKFNRFFVRYFWKYMQKWFGISDPTSPAKNYTNLIKVEKKLNKWIVKNNNQMVICGHTHRPRFPDPGDIPHFNDGSCVHPNSIIGIEIINLKISLIKWYEIHNSKTNKKEIKRVILEGPTDLDKFL